MISQNTRHLHPTDQLTLRNIRILEEQFPWLWATRSRLVWNFADRFSIHVQKITDEFLLNSPRGNNRQPNSENVKTEYWIKIRHVNWLMVSVEIINVEDCDSIAQAIDRYLRQVFYKEKNYHPITDFIVVITTTKNPNDGSAVEQIEIYKPRHKDEDLGHVCFKLCQK